jgi:hypothetical protein
VQRIQVLPGEYEGSHRVNEAKGLPAGLLPLPEPSHPPEDAADVAMLAAPLITAL